jgi:large subunit ribosomal protein L6
MGRLGRLPVSVPESVKLDISGQKVTVTGLKGTLSREFPSHVAILKDEEGIKVSQKGDTKQSYSDQGSARSHIANMVQGVSDGWKKVLEINGPGYRGEVRGRELVLSVGHSHPINVTAPEGVSFKIEKNVLTVEGLDKEVVGHISALIRDTRRPNPYTGSGVKYQDEVIRRKVGKQAGKTE